MEAQALTAVVLQGHDPREGVIQKPMNFECTSDQEAYLPKLGKRPSMGLGWWKERRITSSQSE